MFLISSEMRVSLSITGSCNLTSLIGDVVIEKQVSIVDEQGKFLIFGELAKERRRVFRFFFGELFETTSVAVYNVGIEVFFARLVRLLPLKIDTLGIGRPVDGARLVTD